MTDKQIIAPLAERVAAIADSSDMKRVKSLWRNLNGLKPDRPCVTIDQLPWGQLNVGGELDLKCADEFNRDIEYKLKCLLFKYDNFRADMIIDDGFAVEKEIINFSRVSAENYGIKIDDEIRIADKGSRIVGHRYNDVLTDYCDIDKIRCPEIFEDKEKTALKLERTKEVIGERLAVYEEGAAPSFQLWDFISMWRGVDKILYDLIDRPEFIHAILDRLTNCAVELIDRLNAQNLMTKKQNYIHCTGALNDILPDKKDGTSKDIWSYGMSQIFSSVSPAMHEEFEYPYLSRIFEKFGLIYYGCCEPLYDRIDMIKKYKNVRKISCSPWSNVKITSEKIGGDYVLSLKPNPAFVATGELNPKAAQDIKQAVDICAENGTPLEIILKDLSTVNYNPNVLSKWEAAVMRIVGAR